LANHDCHDVRQVHTELRSGGKVFSLFFRREDAHQGGVLFGRNLDFVVTTSCKWVMIGPPLFSGILEELIQQEQLFSKSVVVNAIFTPPHLEVFEFARPDPRQQATPLFEVELERSQQTGCPTTFPVLMFAPVPSHKLLDSLVQVEADLPNESFPFS
jgi:hypothetical protein